MSKEVRGMIFGLCIVLLATAAYFLKEKPATTPSTPTATTQRPMQ